MCVPMHCDLGHGARLDMEETAARGSSIDMAVDDMIDISRIAWDLACRVNLEINALKHTLVEQVSALCEHCSLGPARGATVQDALGQVVIRPFCSKLPVLLTGGCSGGECHAAGRFMSGVFAPTARPVSCLVLFLDATVEVRLVMWCWIET